MASHLSDIGFPVRGTGDIEELVQRATEEGGLSEPYIRWAPGQGVELWLQVTPEGEVVGFNPHFAGAGRMRIGGVQLISSEEFPLDGCIHGWADPEDEEAESGLFPLVIDIPDFEHVRGRIATGEAVTVQVAAFAHELSCYASDEAFDAAQEQGFKWAPEAFMPMGLFGPDGEDVPPRAEALLSGHVRQAELRTNPVTGEPFHCLSVQTLGGVVDVVADPSVVDGAPVVGGVVQGTFWLSGRVLGKQV